MQQLNIRIPDDLCVMIEEFLECLVEYDESELPTQVLYNIKKGGKKALVEHALRAFFMLHSTGRF